MTTLTHPASTLCPEHAAAHNTHQRVLDMVSRLLSAPVDREALDVPCGVRALSACLVASELCVLSADIAVRDIHKIWFSALLRPWLTRSWPTVMRSEILFYAGVMIYGRPNKKRLDC